MSARLITLFVFLNSSLMGYCRDDFELDLGMTIGEQIQVYQYMQMDDNEDYLSDEWTSYRQARYDAARDFLHTFPKVGQAVILRHENITFSCDESSKSLLNFVEAANID